MRDQKAKSKKRPFYEDSYCCKCSSSRILSLIVLFLSVYIVYILSRIQVLQDIVHNFSRWVALKGTSFSSSSTSVVLSTGHRPPQDPSHAMPFASKEFPRTSQKNAKIQCRLRIQTLDRRSPRFNGAHSQAPSHTNIELIEYLKTKSS